MTTQRYSKTFGIPKESSAKGVSRKRYSKTPEGIISKYLTTNSKLLIMKGPTKWLHVIIITSFRETL